MATDLDIPRGGGGEAEGFFDAGDGADEEPAALVDFDLGREGDAGDLAVADQFDAIDGGGGVELALELYC